MPGRRYRFVESIAGYYNIAAGRRKGVRNPVMAYRPDVNQSIRDSYSVVVTNPQAYVLSSNILFTDDKVVSAVRDYVESGGSIALVRQKHPESIIVPKSTYYENNLIYYGMVSRVTVLAQVGAVVVENFPYPLFMVYRIRGAASSFNREGGFMTMDVSVAIEGLLMGFPFREQSLFLPLQPDSDFLYLYAKHAVKKLYEVYWVEPMPAVSLDAALEVMRARTLAALKERFRVNTGEVLMEDVCIMEGGKPTCLRGLTEIQMLKVVLEAKAHAQREHEDGDAPQAMAYSMSNAPNGVYFYRAVMNIGGKASS